MAKLPMQELTPYITQLSLVRQLKFCAGHRLYQHESKCAFFHGHNYRVDVEVAGESGGTEVDSIGRIVDFSMIKKRMLVWETDEACAVATLVGDPAEITIAIKSAVIVDSR